jgi:L-rhamnose mutarotase
MVIRLKPEYVEAYKDVHKSVPPAVLRTIEECNISNYTIFLRQYVLFGYFEYSGKDFAADMAMMAADPETQKWWALTGPMQDPYPDRAPGEWWTFMDEVFHKN